MNIFYCCVCGYVSVSVCVYEPPAFYTVIPSKSFGGGRQRDRYYKVSGYTERQYYSLKQEDKKKVYCQPLWKEMFGHEDGNRKEDKRKYREEI